jgi:hypothetical protein
MLSGFGLSKNAVANGFLFQFVRVDPAEHPGQRSTTFMAGANFIIFYWRELQIPTQVEQDF